jgi:hypothetical protein
MTTATTTKETLFQQATLIHNQLERLGVAPLDRDFGVWPNAYGVELPDGICQLVFWTGDDRLQGDFHAEPLLQFLTNYDRNRDGLSLRIGHDKNIWTLIQPFKA